MRAVRLHGVGELRVEDLPPPGRPPPSGVRIRVQAAGICGSDLHNFVTGRWISPPPLIPGHDLAGEVVEVGDEVSDYRPGDLVVADSRISCGTCGECRARRNNVCARLGCSRTSASGGAEIPTSRDFGVIRRRLLTPSAIRRLRWA